MCASVCVLLCDELEKCVVYHSFSSSTSSFALKNASECLSEERHGKRWTKIVFILSVQIKHSHTHVTTATEHTDEQIEIEKLSYSSRRRLIGDRLPSELLLV